MITFLVIVLMIFYVAGGLFVGSCMAACVFVNHRKQFKWPDFGEWFLALYFFVNASILWPGFIVIVVPMEWLVNRNEQDKHYMSLDSYEDLKAVIHHLGGSFHKHKEIQL